MPRHRWLRKPTCDTWSRNRANAAAAARGNHGGRPKVIDDDMLTAARALRDKGTPIPKIAQNLTIKTGKNAGKQPSVASLYRALADDAPAVESTSHG